MTENMRKFVEANKNSPVYFGAMLGKDLRDIEDFSEWPKEGFTQYMLTNGMSFLLSYEDKVSAPDYDPNWCLNEENN